MKKICSFKKNGIRIKELFNYLSPNLIFLTAFLLINSITIENLFAEESKNKISFDLVDSAQITDIAYYLKDFKGKKTVHFDLAVKNISNTPKRFKVQIFLSDGPSASYYYPLKPKPPQTEAVIEPGKIFTGNIPLVFYEKIPSIFQIVIREM